MIVLGILTAALAFTAIWNGWIGYMPPVEDLQNPINRFATQIYSADGKVIGTWNFNRENRVCVNYDDLAPSLVKAFGEDFDFATVKAEFEGDKQTHKEIRDYTRDLLTVLSLVDDSIREDVVALCLAVVTVDGKISLKERKYIKKLILA